MGGLKRTTLGAEERHEVPDDLPEIGVVADLRGTPARQNVGRGLENYFRHPVLQKNSGLLQEVL